MPNLILRPSEIRALRRQRTQGGIAGPQGPAGPTGATGATGPAGTNGTNYSDDFGIKHTYTLLPAGNSTTLSAVGMTVSTTGTVTTRTVSSADSFAQYKRIGYASAASAGSSASVRGSDLQFFRGSSAGLGGFRFVCVFGVSDAASVANSRLAVGLFPATADLGNVDPSSKINCVYIGSDAGQTTLRIGVNDGSGTATTINLGANFPAQSISTDVYRIEFYCTPNGSSIDYNVKRLNTGDTASGTLSSDLPLNTQLLSPHVWRNNGTTALAVRIDLISMYIQTAYNT